MPFPVTAHLQYDKDCVGEYAGGAFYHNVEKKPKDGRGHAEKETDPLFVPEVIQRKYRDNGSGPINAMILYEIIEHGNLQILQAVGLF